MKLLLSCLVALLTLAGCSGCGSSFPWISNTPDEASRQEMMRRAVQVKNKMAVVGPPGTKGFIPASISGTGAVYAVRDGESLVVTSGHVCEVPDAVSAKKAGLELPDDVDVELPVIFNTYTVLDISGNEHAAEVLVQRVEHDVCVLRVAGIFANPARVSLKIPPLGGRLDSATAPNGLFMKWTVVYQTGYFSGFGRFPLSSNRDPSDILLVVSIPCTVGCSGSAVYYNGEVVGFVDMVGGFQGVSYLVNAAQISVALGEALKKWRPTNRAGSKSRQ